MLTRATGHFVWLVRLPGTHGRRLKGDRGDRPTQKVRWRRRKCFYPPNI